MDDLHITPTWHKPGYHLHEFDDEGVWQSAEFYPTKERAEQALKDAGVVDKFAAMEAAEDELIQRYYPDLNA